MSPVRVAKQKLDIKSLDLFCSTSLSQLVLDGFDQLLSISCTVLTLSSALLTINLYDIKKFEFEKILGTLRIEPRPAW